MSHLNVKSVGVIQFVHSTMESRLNISGWNGFPVTTFGLSSQ